MTTSDGSHPDRHSDDLLRGGTGERGVPGDPDTDPDLLEGGTGSAADDRVGTPPDQRDPVADVTEAPVDPRPDMRPSPDADLDAFG